MRGGLKSEVDGNAEVKANAEVGSGWWEGGNTKSSIILSEVA